MNSLAPSTRKGYDYAVEGYRSHQRQHGLDAGFTRMTAVSVANYLAHLGNETDLCYNTIRTYRSRCRPGAVRVCCPMPPVPLMARLLKLS